MKNGELAVVPLAFNFASIYWLIFQGLLLFVLMNFNTNYKLIVPEYHFWTFLVNSFSWSLKPSKCFRFRCFEPIQSSNPVKTEFDDWLNSICFKRLEKLDFTNIPKVGVFQFTVLTNVVCCGTIKILAWQQHHSFNEICKQTSSSQKEKLKRKINQ